MDALFATPVGALLIFVLRVVDVAMATVRMVSVVRGYRGWAAGIGFAEVLIWVIAAGHALHLDSPIHVVSYAAGFGMGSYVGMWLEGQFALGYNLVRGICRTEASVEGETAGQEAARVLRERGYAVTEVAGQGRESQVDVLNAVVQRKQVPDVIRILQRHGSGRFRDGRGCPVDDGRLRPPGRTQDGFFCAHLRSCLRVMTRPTPSTGLS